MPALLARSFALASLALATACRAPAPSAGSGETVAPAQAGAPATPAEAAPVKAKAGSAAPEAGSKSAKGPVANACADAPGSALDVRADLRAPGVAHGIDVSHFNGPVPWRTLSQAGLTYAFAKATEGLDYTDPRFVQNWAAMKACGIPRGAYHFLVPKDDPVVQAEHFLSVLGDDLGELPLVVDVERGAKGSRHPCKALQSNLRTFLSTVEAKTGRTVMIYSGADFWKTRMCDDQSFSKRPLWVARYSKTAPELFGGWKRWDFWQYSQRGDVGGSHADLDRFRGDPTALQAWLRAE